MATATISTLDPVLKVIYERECSRLAYEGHAFLALVPKDEKFGGKNWTYSVRYGVSSGRSAVFGTAQANANPNIYEDFVVTRANDYAVAQITGEALEASEGGDANTSAEGLQGEIDGAFENISQSLATALYRSGTGTIGRISAASNTATATITLAQPLDIVNNFEVGAVLRVSATDGGGAGVRTGTVTVLSLDRDAGTITATGNWTAGIAAAVAGDYISIDGDYDAKIKGLGAWIPASTPSATAFFSVDRTRDPVRLAGQRYNGNGAPFEETWQKIMSKGMINSAGFDKGFMNPDDHYLLAVAMGNKGILDRTKASPKDMPLIGFRGFKVVGSSGELDVIADRDCPKGTGFALTMSSMKLKSIGKAPRLLTDDTLKVLRQATADAYEARAGYRAQLGVMKPVKNCNITW